MQGYGDVSGHFRGLIQGDCDVVVVGVVFGDQIQAGRCAKKTVRNIQHVEEAKWNDLNETQKRRILECFEEVRGLEFGYSLFTREKLRRLEDQYLLYQDVSFPPDWDLALTGYAYGELLLEYGALDARRVIFEFDRVASDAQSNSVATHIGTFVPEATIQVGSSHNTPGIQAADCFAGAIAEDYKKETDWLSILDSETITDCTAGALIQLENDLTSYDR
ncbi:DUF3800 domain-containing protein [Halovivax limisalsi]|uniref:DUF3800 domain-containing protein n=1 Tax=Halovivax limisalsi TaxID=1453760 RepID=UPI001FFD94A8|nr:DUF3800 domain-containing protein [Halovivax limisalsi]